MTMGDNPEEDATQGDVHQKASMGVSEEVLEENDRPVEKTASNRIILPLHAEPVVADMAVMCYWRATRSRDNWCELGEEFLDLDAFGMAEVALYAKIFPAPGASIRMLHLNKNMALRSDAFRVIPLLPDGSSPREAPGPAALHIPVVSGRYRKNRKGQMGRHLSAALASSFGPDSVDGAIEQDGEDDDDDDDNESERSPSTSVVEYLNYKTALDGAPDPDIIRDDCDENEEVRQKAAEKAKLWLENYNSGAQLSEDHNGHLCIEFADNMRRDPIVVEIYLLQEPIQEASDTPGRSIFVYGGLPPCEKGIDVSFSIDSFDKQLAWEFDTRPNLAEFHNLGTMLTGLYKPLEGDTSKALVIRVHETQLSWLPEQSMGLDAEIKVEIVPDMENGCVIFDLSAQLHLLVANAEKFNYSYEKASVAFKIEQLPLTDTISLEKCPGGEVLWDARSEAHILRVTRPMAKAFDDVFVSIFLKRDLDDLSVVQIPRISICNGDEYSGFIRKELVKLASLAGMSLRYKWHKMRTWELLIPDESFVVTHDFLHVREDDQDSAELLSFGLEEIVSLPIPGRKLSSKIPDTLSMELHYDLHPTWDNGLSEDGPLYHLRTSILYDTSTKGPMERVFTVAANGWTYLSATVNKQVVNDGLFEKANQEETLFVASNVNYDSDPDENGRQLELLRIEWASTGQFVGLNEEGKIVTNNYSDYSLSYSEDKIDRYEKIELPSVIDNWTEAITASLHWKSGERPLSTMRNSDETPVTPKQRAQSPYGSPDSDAARSPGNSRLGGSGIRTHMSRGTLEGEIFRDPSIYLVREGVDIVAFIPMPIRTVLALKGAKTSPERKVALEGVVLGTIDELSENEDSHDETTIKITETDLSKADEQVSLERLETLTPIIPEIGTFKLSHTTSRSSAPIPKSKPLHKMDFSSLSEKQLLQSFPVVVSAISSNSTDRSTMPTSAVQSVTMNWEDITSADDIGLSSGDNSMDFMKESEVTPKASRHIKRSSPRQKHHEPRVRKIEDRKLVRNRTQSHNHSPSTNSAAFGKVKEDSWVSSVIRTLRIVLPLVVFLGLALMTYDYATNIHNIAKAVTADIAAARHDIQAFQTQFYNAFGMELGEVRLRTLRVTVGAHGEVLVPVLEDVRTFVAKQGGRAVVDGSNGGNAGDLLGAFPRDKDQKHVTMSEEEMRWFEEKYGSKPFYDSKDAGQIAKLMRAFEEEQQLASAASSEAAKKHDEKKYTGSTALSSGLTWREILEITKTQVLEGVVVMAEAGWTKFQRMWAAVWWAV